MPGWFRHRFEDSFGLLHGYFFPYSQRQSEKLLARNSFSDLRLPRMGDTLRFVFRFRFPNECAMTFALNPHSQLRNERVGEARGVEQDTIPDFLNCVIGAWEFWKHRSYYAACTTPPMMELDVDLLIKDECNRRSLWRGRGWNSCRPCHGLPAAVGRVRVAAATGHVCRRCGLCLPR